MKRLLLAGVVALAVGFLAAAGHAQDTVKIGLMDEERRTSLNLAACIGAARNRVIFVNTGFLDRTGDEIHSDMLAGPLVRKGDMRSTKWQQAYERQNRTRHRIPWRRSNWKRNVGDAR